MPGPHPLERLDPAEQDFVLRLVLASGSLKGLARAYRVSYPTIRTRLDRLITKLARLDAGQDADPFGDALADLVERGELSLTGARAIRDLHRRLLQHPREENE